MYINDIKKDQRFLITHTQKNRQIIAVTFLLFGSNLLLMFLETFEAGIEI